MSRRERLISAFIVFHLLAITVTAIPAPDLLKPESQPVESELSALGRSLAPLADATVAPLRALQLAAWTGTKGLRAIVRPYVQATWLFEQWDMFSGPSRVDHYIVLWYYTSVPGSPLLRVQRELISPAHGEGGSRLMNSPGDAFRDKAIVTFVLSYLKRVRDHDPHRSEASERSQEVVYPIIRTYAARFKTKNVTAGETLVRTDLWRGTAPIPPTGQTVPTETLEERRQVLERYQGHVDVALVPRERLPRFGAVFREADLTWTLLATVDAQ
jgi:hypothetical protein